MAPPLKFQTILTITGSLSLMAHAQTQAPSSSTTSTTQTFSSPTYPPTIIGTSSATSNNTTAPSISPQEGLDSSLSPSIISTAITNSTNNIGGESSPPTTSTTQGGSSNSLSPTINENTTPTYSPTIINFPTSNNSTEGLSSSSPTSLIIGSSSIPTSVIGEGGINSNVPTPSISQTDIIGNGTLAPTPSVSSEVGLSFIPTPFEDVLSNGTLSPTPGGTNNNTLLSTPNGTTTITDDINGTSIISGDTNSSASPTPYPTLSLPNFGTYSPTTFAVGGDDDYSYKWPTMSPSLGDGSSTPTFYGTGAPYYTYDASGTDAPTTFNESSSPTMAGSSEGSSSVSLSPTEGGTASESNTTTSSPVPTPSVTNITSSDAPTLAGSFEVSSFAPSESVSGESTLSPVPTPSLTGGGVNTTAPTSLISTSLPTLFGESSEPTAAPMSSTTDSPTSTEPTASQTNPPSAAVTNEATTSPPTARATAELIITVVPPGPDDDIISIPDEEPPPQQQQQEEESFQSYSVGEDIPEDISPPEVGATHYADVHNKESEENEIPHFEGHVKMSAENTISLPPPQDNGISPDLIDGQISFRHHEMDHMIAEGHSTADEVEEDINSSLMHVRRSHISAEGQEYERFKKKFNHVGGISLGMFSKKENEDIYQEELIEEDLENSTNSVKSWSAVLLVACTWITLTI